MKVPTGYVVSYSADQGFYHIETFKRHMECNNRCILERNYNPPYAMVGGIFETHEEGMAFIEYHKENNSNFHNHPVRELYNL